MSTAESILKLLEQWPAWKRITSTPERVDKLEKRIAALERRLQPAPGETCPSCGEPTYRVKESKEPDIRPLGKFGARIHVKRCEKCGFEDEVMITPK